VTVNATAVDTGGSITQVDFYANGTWFAKATSAPFTVTYVSSTAGSYTLTAIATDSNNKTGAASGVPITIASSGVVPASPTISQLVPNTAVAGGAGFTLTVNGTSFVQNSGVYWNGQLLATTYVSSSQLTAIVPVALVTQSGTISVTVVNPAVSNISSPAASFIISGIPVAPPTVTLTAPANQAAYTSPASIVLTATPMAAQGATIAKVDFYSGTTLAGTATTAPYSYTANGLAAGPYTFKAIATDSNGNTGTSNSATVTVYAAPTISTLSPASAIMNSGTFTLKVAGTGFVSTDVVQWNGQPLATTFVSATALTAVIPSTLLTAAGTPAVTVVNPSVTNAISQPTSFTITAPVLVPPNITLTAPTASASFTAPASVTVTASPVAFSGASVTSVAFYIKSSTTSILASTVASAPYTYVITNVAAGTYTLTAVVTDSNGKTTTSAPVSISVTAATGTVINETSLGNVSITLGGLTRVGKTTSYAQSVTVKNTSTATIIGPISLVLDNLSAAATLTGAAGKTTVPSLGTVGSPYVSSTGNLSPGATTVYSLTFSDPTLGVITYQSRILAGPGTR
jgi:hypothetical protein